MTHDSKSMGNPAFLPRFTSLKWTLANNHLVNLRRHKLVHLGVALVLLIMLLGGGTILFHMVFNFLAEQEIFGRPLMSRLIQMILLAFFSMLIFSNLIIMLSTTYISREVDFLMALPIHHRNLFFAKLGESMIYSSWAFVILSFPFFISIGQAWKADWIFYPAALMLVIPYLIIPACLGAVLTLAISAFFPARHTIRYAIALGALGIALALFAQRYYHIFEFVRGRDRDEIAQMMRFFGIADHIFLPSGWLGRGLSAIEQHDWRRAGMWGLALWTTAAQGLLLCDWLAGPLYYKGWNASRSTSRARRNGRFGYYEIFDRMLTVLPRPARAMVTKDLAVFWRDPSQWGQLMILFGLLMIYFVNLRSSADFGQFEILTSRFRSLISMFNIGATAFVLSILTTRFVYPMLSLEGKQQWVIGLAPQKRTRAIWIKFLVSWLGCITMAVPLALLSCYMLEAGSFVTALSLLTIFTLSIGLNGLAVGLGALLPNFAEDNPARIANGLGGTINIVVSLMYIGVTLALETPWVFRWVQGPFEAEWMDLVLQSTIPVWLLIQVGMFAIPMTLGLRHWKRIEF